MSVNAFELQTNFVGFDLSSGTERHHSIFGINETQLNIRPTVSIKLCGRLGVK